MTYESTPRLRRTSLPDFVMTPIEANNGASGSSGTVSASVTSVSANAWFFSVGVAEDWFKSVNHHNITQPLIDQSYENTYAAVRPNKVSAGARALTYLINSSQPYAISGVAIKPALTSTIYVPRMGFVNHSNPGIV